MEPIQNFIEIFLKRKKLGVLIALGLAVGVGISTFYRGAISPRQRTDLTVYLMAGQMVQEGRAYHIYGIENARHWHYNYAPLLAILLAPVSKWPLAATVLLAYLLSLACLAGMVLLSRRFPDNKQEPSACRAATTNLQGCASVPASLGCRPAPWQITLAMIFCLPLFLNTFTRGQLGITALFFQAAIFYAYVRKKKIMTGLLFAFIVTLKISPLAFLGFFFLMKREWKILAFAAAGFLLFFFLIPALAIGFHQNWELLKIWKTLMSSSQAENAYKHYLWGELFTPFTDDNQSLYAVVTRGVWPSLAEFIGHSNAPVRFLTLGYGIFLLALPFVQAPKDSFFPEKDPLRAFAEFSLFPMLMLFISPVTQIHHYTAVYFLFLAALLMRDRVPRGSRMRGCLETGIWLCAFSITLGMIFSQAGYWGAPLWGSMILWIAVLGALRTSKKSVGQL